MLGAPAGSQDVVARIEASVAELEDERSAVRELGLI